MKRYLRRNRLLLLMLLLIVLSFNTVSCNKVNKANVSKPENTQITENPEPVHPDVTNSESVSTDKLIYDSSKTLEDNIDILNKILKSRYGKTLSISAADDYEKAGPSDWTLVLDSARVGIDTSTWKFNNGTSQMCYTAVKKFNNLLRTCIVTDAYINLLPLLDLQSWMLSIYMLSLV